MRNETDISEGKGRDCHASACGGWSRNDNNHRESERDLTKGGEVKKMASKKRRVPNWQRQAWLIEYQTCQQLISMHSSRFWVIVGIFLPINTALLGWMVSNFIAHLPKLNIIYSAFFSDNFTWLILISILSISVIVILIFLICWLKRINALISAICYRMQEIEPYFGMRANEIINCLDHWEIPFDKQKGELAELHKKHFTLRETTIFSVIIGILIFMWFLFIIFAWLLPVINKVIS